MSVTRSAVRHASHKLMLQTGLGIASLALSISAAYGAPVFDQPDPDFNGRLSSFGAPALPAGKAVISGRSFKPGQEVTLSSNGTILNPNGPLVADEKGVFKGEISIPADAVPGIHPVVVQVAKPSAASIFNFKISPVIALSGQEKFTATAKKMVPGVYQSAYSEKTDSLFVTAAVGRPPVKESQLLKVNPTTLDIEAKVTPAVDKDNDKGQLMAVYGVATDDAHNNVWVTNTRAGTVAVYKQSDLKLVKQFSPKAAPHARDVVIDAKRSKAYVSTPGNDHIVIFDTSKLTEAGKIELPSESKEEFSPMSVALDSKAGKLYTVSLSTNEAAIIDLDTEKVEKMIALPRAKAASGVAVDSSGKRLFVAAQGTDNVLIVDLASGKVLHDVAVGAGPLNITYDPVSKYAYVAIRGAGTVAVLNEDGKIIANLEAGTYPNHITVDGKGHAFVLNKSRGKDDETADRLTRLNVKM